MFDLVPWVGELVIGVVLLAFAAAFRGWSNRLGEGLKKLDKIETALLQKLELLSKEFHMHTVSTERRVTRVETKIDLLLNEKPASNEPPSKLK